MPISFWVDSTGAKFWNSLADYAQATKAMNRLLDVGALRMNIIRWLIWSPLSAN